jgi:hypothetical protein
MPPIPAPEPVDLPRAWFCTERNAGFKFASNTMVMVVRESTLKSSGSGSGGGSSSDPRVDNERQHALLPIGVAAVEMSARLCACLFQQPRLEHGFFMRTADFLTVTAEMSTTTTATVADSSQDGDAAAANENTDNDNDKPVPSQADTQSQERAREHEQQGEVNDQQQDQLQAHSSSGHVARTVRAKQNRYHELSHRLRHAAWQLRRPPTSSDDHSEQYVTDDDGQMSSGPGLIIEIAAGLTEEDGNGNGNELTATASCVGCAARWEGKGEDHSGRVRYLLWQELISRLSHCLALS